jgi:hypothetical protein
MTLDHEQADGRHDFDFIFGPWRVANRRLADQTDPHCTEWIEFETTSRARPVFGGLAHVDLIDAGPDVPNGPWQGLTLRQFEPAARLWHIWWASSRNPGRLDPPLSGTFVDGTGKFDCDDEVAGRPVKVHFEWLNPEPDVARWTQSFSFDDGRTWVPNWVMEFRRPGTAG